MTVKIPRTLLLTILSSAFVNCNARNDLIPEHVAAARRCVDLNGELVRPDIQKIVRPENELEMMHESGEPVYLSQLQLRPQYTETKPPLDLALEGQTQMAELQCEPNSCTAGADTCVKCSATYCMTNVDLVSAHPEKYFDFMTVIDTEHCRVQPKSFGLNQLYDEMMEYDSKDGARTFSLPLRMGIFEMGHTDTERLTKALSLDHTKMVHVNAQPLIEALMVCDDKRKQLLSREPCDRDKVVDLVRKIAYLECRTTDIYYEQCIVKFPPEATQAIDIFESAFPDAETFYIYHEPETFLGGTFTNPDHPERAMCAKHKRQPSNAVATEANELGRNSKDMSIHELCSLEARIGMKKALNQKMNTNRVKFVHADALMENLSFFTHTQEEDVQTLAMRSVADTNEYGTTDTNQYAISKETKKSRVDNKMVAAASDILSGVYATIIDQEGSDMQV